MEIRSIRARFDDRSIRVYQAFRAEIADAALAAQRFVAPFSMSRMTWIKPSFNWMMYRCGYGAKPDQERVLAVDVTREGFEWALSKAVLSTFHPDRHPSREMWEQELKNSPVRIQWDPERDWRIQKIVNLRSIQIGLHGDAVRRYAQEWIRGIEDVTAIAQRVGRGAEMGAVPDDLPDRLEREYPLTPELAASVGLSRR